MDSEKTHGKVFKTGVYLKVILSASFAFSTLSQHAQTATVSDGIAVTQTPSSPYQEPLFYLMCLVAFLLLVFILQLSKLLSAVAKNYSRNSGNVLKTIVVLLALSFVPAKSEAQDFGLEFLKEGFGQTAYNALAVIIFIELLVVLYYPITVAVL